MNWYDKKGYWRLLGGIISQIETDEEPPAVGLTLASGVDDEDLLPFDDDEPSKPSISRIYTNGEIDKFTPDELNKIADKQGITFTGPKT